MLLETNGPGSVGLSLCRRIRAAADRDQCLIVVLGEGGIPLGLVTTCEDISDRERVAAELRDSEQRYRLLFERNLAGVYRATVDGELLGYTVIAAGSGEEALALVEGPAFDVLLTDLVLPGASGAELARAFDQTWPGLPVILMSGYTEDEAVKRGILEGRLRFLEKPFGVRFGLSVDGKFFVHSLQRGVIFSSCSFPFSLAIY